ncbi:MAG: hypothetical protein OHK0039_36970 [Bacteroidia bacterium]
MKRIFYILPFLLLAACDAIVDRPLPEHTPRLVVNAFFQPGLPMDVYLTRSYGPLEDLSLDDILVSDARVELFKSNQSLGVLPYRDTVFNANPFPGEPNVSGKYESAQVADTGATYTLRISHPTYGEAEATTRIPLPVRVRRVWVEQSVAQTIDNFGNTQGFQSLVYVEIDDPAGEVNFYEFGAKLWVQDSLYGSDPFVYDAFLYGTATPGTNGGYDFDSALPNDAGKDGQTITYVFLTYLHNAYEEKRTIDIQSVVLTSSSYNEDYARFKEELNRQRSTNTGGFTLIPPEAVIVYSNVEGGYGIFSGITTSRDSFPQ